MLPTKPCNLHCAESIQLGPVPALLSCNPHLTTLPSAAARLALRWRNGIDRTDEGAPSKLRDDKLPGGATPALSARRLCRRRGRAARSGNADTGTVAPCSVDSCG